MFPRVSLALLGALSLGLITSPAAAAATKVTCRPTQVTATVSETFRNTTSTTFVPLAEAGGRFVQGGSEPSCVMVRFEGYVATTNNAVLTISASIDDETIAPDQVQLLGIPLYEPRAWTFIIPRVAPGKHRIKFVFRSNNGNSVGFNASNTIIQHAP